MRGVNLYIKFKKIENVSLGICKRISASVYVCVEVVGDLEHRDKNLSSNKIIKNDKSFKALK